MPSPALTWFARALALVPALLAVPAAAGGQDSGAIGIRLSLAPPPQVEWRGALFEPAPDTNSLEGELHVRCLDGQRFRIDLPDHLVRAGRRWDLSGASGNQACSGRAQRFVFLARRSGAALEQEQPAGFGVTFY